MKLPWLNPVQWIVVAVASLFLLAIGGATGTLVWQLRQAALADADKQAQRFSTSAAAAFNRTLVDLDVVLTNMGASQNLTEITTTAIDRQRLSQSLREEVQHTLILRRLVLFDDHAQVLASSDLSGHSRLRLPEGYLQRALAPVVSEMVVSQPMQPSVGSEPVLLLGRHMRLADGHRLLAVGEVSINHLTTILLQGADIPGLEATLERPNGQMLAASPPQDQLLGTLIAPPLQSAQGLAQVHSARLSGLPAQVAAKPTLHDSLLVVASIPLASALSKWTVERDFIVLVAVLFAVMVVASAGLASWYLERLAQARNAIKQSQAEVEQLAFHDHLTHLPNRLLLTERLSHALASSLRHQRFGVLLFMDLDNFKNLNDTQGHDTGDLLLKQVAQRLTGNVRSQDTVARLGGDEFVIMLEGLADTPTEAGEIAQRIGEKLLAALNQPYVFGDQMHKSSASLGAALFGGEPMMPAELLKQADIAMYQAKAAGRNALCFFDPQMQEAISAHAALEADLQIALAQEQFRLYYQSQIDHLGRVVGAEVLIRWLHPDRGLVPPGQFIAVAEESELINQIGLWVLRTACAQLRVWQSEPVTAPLQLSVNVSARQFRQSDFVQQVEDVLAQSAIQPNGLKLELTESLVLANVADTIAKMSALKELGVRFSMDDFGTGQSSLSYLTRLPLDQLKIDQSFVRNIGIKSTDGVIVQTIIGMARNLGLEVIAEGVETQAQLNYLAQHGCLYYQGYLFGKPAPLEQFELQLAHHHQKAQLPA